MFVLFAMRYMPLFFVFFLSLSSLSSSSSSLLLHYIHAMQPDQYISNLQSRSILRRCACFFAAHVLQEKSIVYIQMPHLTFKEHVYTFILCLFTLQEHEFRGICFALLLTYRTSLKHSAT